MPTIEKLAAPQNPDRLDGSIPDTTTGGHTSTEQSDDARQTLAMQRRQALAMQRRLVANLVG
jgi:hypothetical protein